jgi:hypothetical protein
MPGVITKPPSPPAPPIDPAPLEYAKPAEETLDIARNDDADGSGLVIRVPPPDVSLHALRIVVWSLGLAAFGTSTAMRVMQVRPRGIATLFIAHAAFMPTPVAAILAVVCLYMVFRVARFGRRWMTIAVDDSGIFIDHPSGLLPRPRRIAFERFAAIEAKPDDSYTYIVLRDGFSSMLPMRSVDQPRVVSVIEEEVHRLRPPRVVAAAPDRAGRVTSTRIPSKRFMRDEHLHARLDTYVDGVRCTVAPSRGWVILHIVAAGFFIWLTMAIANFAIPLEPYMFIQWTGVYAALMIALFMSQTPSQRGRHPKDVVLDVVGDTLILVDPDDHGRHDRWRRDEIAQIRIGGPIWWIARGGRLSVKLTEGSLITLLHGYPLCVLRPVAEELRRALGMVTAASAASPPRERG